MTWLLAQVFMYEEIFESYSIGSILVFIYAVTYGYKKIEDFPLKKLQRNIEITATQAINLLRLLIINKI